MGALLQVHRPLVRRRPARRPAVPLLTRPHGLALRSETPILHLLADCVRPIQLYSHTPYTHQPSQVLRHHSVHGRSADAQGRGHRRHSNLSKVRSCGLLSLLGTAHTVRPSSTTKEWRACTATG